MTWANVAIAGASIVSGYLGSEASKDAAGAATKGNNAAIAEQRRQFDIIMGLNKPGIVTGTGAYNKIAQLLGLPYSEYQEIGRPGGSAGGGLTPRQGTHDSGLPLAGTSIVGRSLGLDGGYKKPAGTLGTDQVLKLLKQGRTVDEIAALSPMSSRHTADSLKKLTKAGLTPEQINKLYAGPAGIAQAEWDAAHPNGGVITPDGPDASVFTESPDYQFRQREGAAAIDRSAASRGGALSGNAVRGQTEYASELASTEYGNFFERLMRVAGLGGAATNTASSAAANTGNNVAGLLQNSGQARASGILGQANSISGSVNSGLTAWLLNRGGYFGAAPAGG